MRVQGSDCSIVIKTTHREMDLPYSEETLREAVSLLEEEAAIEGNGNRKAIRKSNGLTGCIVAPLTIGTAPLLLTLAMGAAGLPVFVSETKDIHKYCFDLLPFEETDYFDLIQDRGGERRIFESCKVKSFELRIMRDETIKLKLDIHGEHYPVVYPYKDIFPRESGERFNGDSVTYKINGKEYQNIYGITLTAKKESGTRTELWIKRVLESGSDIPHIIDEFTITAQLLREKYEYRYFGTFRITLKRLVLTSDETIINSSDTVIGPLRFYVSDTVSTEVFSSGQEEIV